MFYVSFCIYLFIFITIIFLLLFLYFFSCLFLYMKIGDFFQKSKLEPRKHHIVYENGMPSAAVQTPRPYIDLQRFFHEFLKLRLKKKMLIKKQKGSWERLNGHQSRRDRQQLNANGEKMPKNRAKYRKTLQRYRKKAKKRGKKINKKRAAWGLGTPYRTIPSHC